MPFAHLFHKGEVVRLTRVVAESQSLGGLLGSSPPMRKVYDLLTRIADSDASVLINGESGTCKELVARAPREEPARPWPLRGRTCRRRFAPTAPRTWWWPVETPRSSPPWRRSSAATGLDRKTLYRKLDRIKGSGE